MSIKLGDLMLATWRRPSKKGWYWYLSADYEPLIVYVDQHGVIEQGGWHVSELHGRWVGPLIAPRTTRIGGRQCVA